MEVTLYKENILYFKQYDTISIDVNTTLARFVQWVSACDV